MKNKNLLILAAVILLSGALFFIFSKTGDSSSKNNPASAQSQPPPAGEHAGHSGGAPQPQPEAKQEQVSEEAPTVEIPIDKQQMIGVKIVEVSLKPLQKVIRTVGRIEYDERRLSTVNTKIEGWVEKLYVDYTGRYVKKGEPLADIYSPELYATQEEFLSALKWAKGDSSTAAIPPLIKGGEGGFSGSVSRLLSKDSEAMLEAARQRLRLWDISESQIKKIEESGKPVRTLTVFSPVSGYVIQKMVVKGMRVMPGEKLFDVADLSTVWIISDIYEYELPLIKPGQTASISLSYFPGRDLISKIDYVYPALSGDTRTAKVRFTIANPGGQLKPQMFTNVEIKIPLGKRFAVPDEAVLDTGKRRIVYVDKGDGYFEPREVMLGVQAEGFKEVTMGLKAGDKVAASATFLIDSEAQLKGVAPPGGHKH